jgi:hypothetical protein
MVHARWIVTSEEVVRPSRIIDGKVWARNVRWAAEAEFGLISRSTIRTRNSQHGTLRILPLVSHPCGGALVNQRARPEALESETGD